MNAPLGPLARRLLRRAASVLCLLSFLVCVAACWLWARSRSGDPYVAWLARADRAYQVRSRDGRLSVLRIDGPGAGAAPAADLTSRVGAYERSFRAQVLLRTRPPPVKSQFAGVEVERGALWSFPDVELEIPLTSRSSWAVAKRQRLQQMQALELLTLRDSGQTGGVTLSDQSFVVDPRSGVMSLTPPPLSPPAGAQAVRLTVPYRLIVALTALLPAAWLAVWARGVHSTRRALRRQRRGLCPACAYDLRGTPAAPRCPECGREVERALAATAPT